MTNQENALSESEILTQLIAGKMVTQAIAVAAQLRVADHLADGPKSADELAQQCGARPVNLYRLLRALADFGLVAEQDGQVFSLTSLGALLRSDAPGSLASMAIASGEAFHSLAWSGLLHSVRTGESSFRHVHGASIFEWLQSHPRELGVFGEAMTSLSRWSGEAIVQAYDFSKFKRVVDVGGGFGFLLATVLKKHSSLKGVLLDVAPVADQARRLMENEDFAQRCEIESGDFFSYVPASGDAFILKHIVHDWPDEAAIKILENCAAALTAGGRVLVIEQILSARGVPSLSKLLDLEMMVLTDAGRERTEPEYRALLERAGLKLLRTVPTRSPMTIIEASKL
jgi:SAM-dependent methyltransferase